MKKTNVLLFISALLMFGLFITGCSKDKATVPVSVFRTKAEAKAIHDNKSGGIYKGVLIGSSGIVRIVLQDGLMQVIMTVDGVTRTLSTTALSTWTSGQLIQNVTFDNGNWSASFSVAADGSNPQLIPNIPGHLNMIIAVVKESSAHLIKLYEGSFSGPGITSPQNRWNFISNDSLVYGIRSDGSGGVEDVNGTQTGNAVSGDAGSGVSFSGTFFGKNVTGIWQDNSDNGTWVGVRKL